MELLVYFLTDLKYVVVNASNQKSSVEFPGDFRTDVVHFKQTKYTLLCSVERLVYRLSDAINF